MHTQRFHTTYWTLIQAASEGLPNESRTALAALCQAYWYPVYSFVRRRVFEDEQARDLTQGFFVLLIEKNYLAAADRERGKFRSFLLTAVKSFLANEHDRATALKRGGGQAPISIDMSEAAGRSFEPVETATPESLFQRQWALSLLERVMSKLREEFVSAGKLEEFNKLMPFLKKDSDSGRYESIAEEIGVSAGALRMSVHRMRRQYRDLMRAQIAETVSSPEDIDEEIRFLLSVLSA
jgi:RNA polymerase sigma-70 factor (ECF subfamily)